MGMGKGVLQPAQDPGTMLVIVVIIVCSTAVIMILLMALNIRGLVLMLVHRLSHR